MIMIVIKKMNKYKKKLTFILQRSKIYTVKKTDVKKLLSKSYL